MAIFDFVEQFYAGQGGGQGGSALNPISVFYNKLRRYPGNNKQWWVAKAPADDDEKKVKEGDFQPEVLDKVFSGNNRAPRGHFVLNAFRKNRSAASGIAGLPLEDTSTRAQGVCFFSGRAWWAASSDIYYSQIINHRAKAGLCFQEADPTSEDISDLIASDGGHIPLPEASNIQRLIPLANGVVVLATNGVWFIGGGNGSFSATSIQINKVSSIGTKSPQAAILVDDTIFWWSEVGIHGLAQEAGQFGPVPGKFGNTNIAEQTIQTLYNNIPENAKMEAKAIYDPKTNVIQWMYSDPYVPYRFNKILNFDLTLQAFYPWEVTDAPSGPAIVGAVLDDGILSSSVQQVITDKAGFPATTISLDNITTTVYNTTVETRPTNLFYLTKVGTDTLGHSMTFSSFSDYSFVDWKTFNGTGFAYRSFIETGYELLDDSMRDKQAVRVFVHMRRTEDDPLGAPTSVKFRTKWDWSSSSNSNKWSREVEAYRPRQMRVPTTADLDSGFPVVTSNNKVRGSGKSVQFRFECSEPNKNFDLLGWSVAYVGNTEP